MATYRDVELVHTGRIEVIVGPMFGGKSSELLRRIRRYARQVNVAVIKYKGDTRYSENQFSTHDKQMMDAISCSKLTDAYEQIEHGKWSPSNTVVDDVEYEGEYNVIGIDEGQFYPDLPEACKKWADEGKVVIVAALDGDIKRKLFGHVSALLPLAEDWVKLRAICDCGLDASFTGLVSVDDLKLNSSGDIAIGGAEKYAAMCRGCHDKFLMKLAKKEKYEKEKMLLSEKKAQSDIVTAHLLEVAASWRRCRETSTPYWENGNHRNCNGCNECVYTECDSDCECDDCAYLLDLQIEDERRRETEANLESDEKEYIPYINRDVDSINAVSITTEIV